MYCYDYEQLTHRILKELGTAFLSDQRWNPSGRTKLLNQFLSLPITSWSSYPNALADDRMKFENDLFTDLLQEANQIKSRYDQAIHKAWQPILNWQFQAFEQRIAPMGFAFVTGHDGVRRMMNHESVSIHRVDRWTLSPYMIKPIAYSIYSPIISSSVFSQTFGQNLLALFDLHLDRLSTPPKNVNQLRELYAISGQLDLETREIAFEQGLVWGDWKTVNNWL